MPQRVPMVTQDELFELVWPEPMLSLLRQARGPLASADDTVVGLFSWLEDL